MVDDVNYLAHLQCTQAWNESVPQYSYRYQLHVLRLRYSDTDPWVIQRYVDGLSYDPQVKLLNYKHTRRSSDPTWEFISLNFTINLAVAMETQSWSPQAQSLPHQGVELKSTTSYSETTNPSRAHRKHKRKHSFDSSASSGSYCEYHPNSQSHSTGQCRLRKRRIQPHYTGSKGSNDHRVPSPYDQPSDHSKIGCFYCQQLGHCAYQCPMKIKPRQA